MYIVAIAWIYVVLMVSVMQTTFFRGVMTFIFTGILPLALLLFLIGTPQRRRNNLAKSQIDSVLDGTEPTEAAVPTVADDPNAVKKQS